MSAFLNKTSLSLAEVTWVSKKVIEIKNDAGWNESSDEVTSERLLLNE